MRCDVLVKNGFVVDGSGRPGRVADVAIGGGRVVAVGEMSGDGAGEVIDAGGRVVAPGFIQPHTHVDPQLWWDPFGLPLVLHGVTSVVAGNCGVTLAPCKEADRAALASVFHHVEEVPLDTLRTAVPWTWETFGDYLGALEGRLGINCGTFVGHSAVRYAVMGRESLERRASDEEIGRMRQIVRDSIRAGAMGFSTGQNKLHVCDGGAPIPSRVASEGEIAALCDVLAEEGRGLFQSDGGIDIAHRAEWISDVGGPFAARSGRTVLAGNVLPQAPAVSLEVLEVVRQFQERGAQVYAQAAPAILEIYLTFDGAPVGFNDLPSWVRVGMMSHDERLVAYRDAATLDALQAEAVDGPLARDWDGIRVYRVVGERNRDLVGVSVGEYARGRGLRLIDALAELLLGEDLGTQFVMGSGNADAAVAGYLRSSQVIVGGSDAGAHVKTFCGAADTSLILSKWVGENGLLTLEEAVRRMTSEPARIMGIAGRGLVAEGYQADLVIFRPEEVSYAPIRTVDDLPGGGERLWRDATGIDHVLVNGCSVVREGVLTGAQPGQVIRSTRSV